MSFFDRGNGVRIYYELKSPADSRDRIVLLSGFAATCGMWDPHLDFLASQGISTLCLDNRGCGQTVSPTTERPLTALDMAMDVVLLLEHVGWGMERVHVWGASMGGFLALSILVRNNRLISLCLQVTCAGLYPFAVPLGEVGWKRIFGVVGMANKTPEEVVSLMMEKGFSKEILEDSERKAKIHQSMVANFARMYSWNMEV
jgi:3-oxoadipate enol-lactonase